MQLLCALETIFFLLVSNSKMRETLHDAGKLVGKVASWDRL